MTSERDTVLAHSSLAVIVPYRDRLPHLEQFFPWVAAFFYQNSFFGYEEVHIVLVEQMGNAPFNRGKLLNVGYLESKEYANFSVFHDVDYLPVSADYTASSQPTRLIWNGLVLKEDYENFFGAVCLIPNSLFEQVNGYPNCYWGWGFEDTEFRERFRRKAIQIAFRDGTFVSLPHAHNGISTGGLSEAALRNRDTFHKRHLLRDELFFSDGVKGTDYGLREKRTFYSKGFERVPLHWLRCLIDA